MILLASLTMLTIGLVLGFILGMQDGDPDELFDKKRKTKK